MPRECCHPLCPWETAPWSSDWHFSSWRKWKAPRTLKLQWSLFWTQNPARVISYCKAPLVTVSVPVLLLAEFVSILSSCEDNKDLPQTLNVSPVQQELKRPSFQTVSIRFKMDSFTLIYIHFSEYYFSIKFRNQWFSFWLFTKETNPSLPGYNDSSATFSKHFLLQQRSRMTKPQKEKCSVSKTVLVFNMLHSV